MSGDSPQGGSPTNSRAGAPQVLPTHDGLPELSVVSPVGEAGQQWGLLGAGVNEVRARLLPELVSAMAEVFLINGDLNSSLYTSSRAMHSAILGLLQVRCSRAALSLTSHGACEGLGRVRSWPGCSWCQLGCCAEQRQSRKLHVHLMVAHSAILGLSLV